MNRITKLVRLLRKKQTPSEALLWKELRNRKLNHLKFLRQHPLIYGSDHQNNPLFFVLDFYCNELQLAIELDGKIHDFQKEYDENRDEIISKLGVRIIRFRNHDLNYMNKVKETILSYIK